MDRRSSTVQAPSEKLVAQLKGEDGVTSGPLATHDESNQLSFR